MNNAPDIIVFSQEEFDAALASGAGYILVCDCRVICGSIKDVRIECIGGAVVETDTEILSDELTPVSAGGTKKRRFFPARGSFRSSFKSSYRTSYRRGSFSSSYRGSFRGSFLRRWEWEWEFERGSYRASYRTSFRTSYKSSYRTSYRGSYGSFTGSAKRRGSYRLCLCPFPTHFEGPYSELLDELFREIAYSDIGGYGIELI